MRRSYCSGLQPSNHRDPEWPVKASQPALRLGVLLSILASASPIFGAQAIDLASQRADWSAWGASGDRVSLAVGVGDFNGDGWLDIAFPRSGNPPTAFGELCLYF